jgi:RNA polymerase sigma factor for flagellar operon FliA
LTAPRGKPRNDDADADLEANLWRDFKKHGSAKAREQLFDLYSPLARAVANRRLLHANRGDLERAEVRQLAYAGLLEAIDRYDFSLGAPFRAYAAKRISGSILDGLAKLSEVRQQVAFLRRLRRDRVRSLAAPGDEARSQEADDPLRQLAELAIGLALGFMLEGTRPYDSPGGEERAQTSPFEGLAWKQALEAVEQEVSSLPDRQQAVIRRHYFEGIDFHQISELLGLSRGRVSQIHKEAIRELRTRLSSSRTLHFEN